MTVVSFHRLPGLKLMIVEKSWVDLHNGVILFQPSQEPDM